MSVMMSGVPGCRRILGVLAAESGVLLIALAFSWAFLLTPSAAGPVGGLLAEVWYLLPLGLFGATYLVLQSLSEPIELVWSLRARQRLKAWIYPALGAGAGLALIGAFFLAFRPLVRLGVASPPGLAPDFLAAAYVIPLVPLVLFSAGALKRYLVMRRNLRDMRAMTAGPRASDEGLDRVRASIETEAGSGTTNVRPHPQGFVVAGLTSRPWHDPDSLPWMAQFKAAAADIREEALRAIDAHRERIVVYNYPGLDGEQWKAFNLVARHQEIAENLAAAPATARLLKLIPGYPSFRDAMFSILAPGGEIKPHRDVSNVFLTMHLGLVAPEGGYMEVAGERRSWRAGEALMFDSSYEHRAVNPSKEPRLILLVDFLHPDLSERERAWVRAARL
ncbi:MAG: aspartyl/asparaginyl beta-hydroxylase domain-containing protein [Amphiplicatus sp.]